MLLERNAGQLIVIVNGRAHRAVMPVVPQSLSRAPVTADPGPAVPSYGMNAAFMSSQPRESGIHAVWSGAGEVSVTKVRFRRAAADGEQRADHDQLKLSKALRWNDEDAKFTPYGLVRAVPEWQESALALCVLSHRNDELTGVSRQRWS